MPKDCELDRLKAAEQAAFQRKQAAWSAYATAREHASAAHDEMESAWAERQSTREIMNREFEARQRAYEARQKAWDEYGRIRDHNNSQIEYLRAEADAEHSAMQDCFNNASFAYENGDKAMAPIYSQEGHGHKDRRNELNAQVSQLIQEVKDAKRAAEWAAPKVDNFAFDAAKVNFDHAKARHEAAQAQFKRLKAERDRLKSEFDAAQAEHKRLKEDFQRRLAAVKTSRQRERDRVLDQAGVRWSDRKDAKIVKKPDGTTQVYSGGLGKGDGYGHGHVALDRSGHKTYERDAFTPHGRQNFKDNSSGHWGPYIRGTIDDHEVTARQGIGAYEGQTLISDGHVSGKHFGKHHNHYGDDARGSGKRIEDIGGDRGEYTGPGH